MALNLEDVLRGISQQAASSVPDWAPAPQQAPEQPWAPPQQPQSPEPQGWGLGGQPVGDPFGALGGGQGQDPWGNFGSAPMRDAWAGISGGQQQAASAPPARTTPQGGRGSYSSTPTQIPGQLDDEQNHWADRARYYATHAGIDPDIFVRQLYQEHGLRPGGVSPAGARGIAQIVPKYHPDANPDDPESSLQYAANLMAQHYRTYGNWQDALIAYNGGGGAVNAWHSGSPYPESTEYVKQILQPGAYPAQAGGTGTDGSTWLNRLEAKGHSLGDKYDWGGKGTPGRGYDCSGLVGDLLYGSHAESTVTLHAKSTAISEADAQPGDEVFWNMGIPDPHQQHVAIYLGGGKILQSGGNQEAINIGDAHQNIGSAPEFRRPTY